MKHKSSSSGTLQGREIILGVSGGIAAYKSVELLRLLQKQGAGITVAMTRHATEFVQPLTFSSLSGRETIVEMFQTPQDWRMGHIGLADNADLMCVAPATANIVGKFANGIADDFLSTLFLSVTCPVVVAPSMNVHMYEHPVVQKNLDTLRNMGVFVLEPEAGDLACKVEGKGRLPDPEKIVTFIESILARTTKLDKTTVLVTAGPTREFLDPIRFISNRSSGKMGYAIAQAAAMMGARVILVSGPTNLVPPRGVEFHPVESASEMLETMKKIIKPATHVIMTSAVADYRPKKMSRSKLKKDKTGMSLELDRTPDILETLVPKYPDKIWVGFAAETDNILKNAHDKLKRKKLDMIIANQVAESGYPLGADSNRVVIVSKKGRDEKLPEMSKQQLATEILIRIIGIKG